jgi:hypothetical protein
MPRGKTTRRTTPYHYGNRDSSKTIPEDYDIHATKAVDGYGSYLCMVEQIKNEDFDLWQISKGYFDIYADCNFYHSPAYTRLCNRRLQRMQAMEEELNREVSKTDYFASRISNRTEMRHFLTLTASQQQKQGLFYASHGLTKITETELVSDQYARYGVRVVPRFS